MHGAVAKLSADVKSKVVGGVLFGDSRNKFTQGTITGFAKDRVLEICNDGDGVCAPGAFGIGGKLSSIDMSSSTDTHRSCTHVVCFQRKS
jgi:hypothetical protein